MDEIQYGRGHQYLTLVYQIEAGYQRLLWVGKERTTESFQQFFALIGKELSERIEFVCSDMWKPYLKLIKKHCTNALNILDRFYIVAKMNLALDDVRAAEARRMAQAGHEPLLKKSRWCLLKRPSNLTGWQRIKLRELLRFNLKSVRAYLLPGPQAVLQRRDRGAEQQGQSHHAKSLRLSNLPGDRNRALSRTWQTTRAKACPQFLLTNHELEEGVGDIPGIRRGCVAVFGSADPASGTEHVIVLAEPAEFRHSGRLR